jgi:predicted nicotinamide N-methyase
MTPADSICELESRLRSQFVVVSEKIACAGSEFEMLHPRSADELISEDEFNVDERLPYWAEVWPSARVLANHLAKEPSSGRSLLELGCGCGFVAIVARHLGYRVVATDYYKAACEFVRLNAARHNMGDVTARHVNWRDWPDDLGQFDIVIAADVLYEAGYGKLVASVIARTLLPHGRSIVADPARYHAATFLQECAAMGLSGQRIAQVPHASRVARTIVDLYELTWSQCLQ